MFIKKFAILFSGNGSNMEALLQKLHNQTFKGTRLECELLITNNPDAYGIQRAAKFGLKPIIINHRDFSSRQEFDDALVAEISKHDIDLTVLAGFMRILTPNFTTKVKAINLHPSILPLFKGANAIKESFESGMMVGGVSVHYVNEELDGGKLILQQTFERKDGMSLDEWESSIHSLEHEILPKAVIKILTKGN